MWTLGKHVLQIQVEVFHAVATTAEHGEDGPNYLAVLIANKLTAKPRWESITEDRIWSNLSKTKNIPPKAVIFSDFLLTFAMPIDDFACLDLQH